MTVSTVGGVQVMMRLGRVSLAAAAPLARPAVDFRHAESWRVVALRARRHRGLWAAAEVA